MPQSPFCFEAQTCSLSTSQGYLLKSYHRLYFRWLSLAKSLLPQSLVGTFRLPLIHLLPLTTALFLPHLATFFLSIHLSIEHTLQPCRSLSPFLHLLWKGGVNNTYYPVGKEEALCLLTQPPGSPAGLLKVGPMSQVGISAESHLLTS